MAGLHGHPQCRRKMTMAGLSWGSLSFSCVGAGSPSFGSGATCFAGGVLNDWSSLKRWSFSSAAMASQNRRTHRMRNRRVSVFLSESLRVGCVCAGAPCALKVDSASRSHEFVRGALKL